MDKPTWDGMTFGQRAVAWSGMNTRDRDAVKDPSDMTPQLIGLEGWRVEVVDDSGETRRFIVGRSIGWRPCHLEVKTRRSHGGMGADRHYQSVTKLYRAR